MHECPFCMETCDCDGEDTWFSWPYNADCTHDCEEDDDREQHYPEDDDILVDDGVAEPRTEQANGAEADGASAKEDTVTIDQ